MPSVISQISPQLNKTAKLVIEIRNLARERGHDPLPAHYHSNGQKANVECRYCRSWAIAKAKPTNGDSDIQGPLIRESCTVATDKRPCHNHHPADGGCKNHAIAGSLYCQTCR